MPFINLGLERHSGLIVYIAAIFIFFLSIGWRPIVGLLFMLPTIPIHTVRARMYELPLGAYFFDFLLLGIFIGLLIRGQLRFPKGIPGVLVVAYMFFTYISLFHGAVFLNFPLPFSFKDPRLSYWHSIMRMPLVYFAAYCCVRTRTHVILVLVFISIGILGLSKSFRKNVVVGRDFSHFSYSIRQGGGAQGYAGINGLASHQAQWGVFFFGLLLAGKEKRKRFAKFAYFGLGAACLYCVVYALSRGAYAAILATWIYWGTVRKKFYLLAPLLIFIFTWQALVPGAVRDRVLGTVDEQTGQIESSAAKRLDLWDSTVELIRSTNIFIGTGFYTYYYLRAGEELRDTHNLYLKLLAETGILGLTLFLAIWFFFYRQAAALYKRASDSLTKAIGFAFCASMVALVVTNVFGDRWFYIQISGYTFVMFGVVNSLYTDLGKGAAAPTSTRGVITIPQSAPRYGAAPRAAAVPFPAMRRTGWTSSPSA